MATGGPWGEDKTLNQLSFLGNLVNYYVGIVIENYFSVNKDFFVNLEKRSSVKRQIHVSVRVLVNL